MKIEELIDAIVGKYVDVYDEQRFSREGIAEIMKQYAEYYAKKCLEIAAENATLLDDGKPTGQQRIIWEAYNTSRSDIEYEVNKKSITDINLPEHE